MGDGVPFLPTHFITDDEIPYRNTPIGKKPTQWGDGVPFLPTHFITDDEIPYRNTPIGKKPALRVDYI